jgi:hypothetical protein
MFGIPSKKGLKKGREITVILISGFYSSLKFPFKSKIKISDINYDYIYPDIIFYISFFEF